MDERVVAAAAVDDAAECYWIQYSTRAERDSAKAPKGAPACSMAMPVGKWWELSRQGHRLDPTWAKIWIQEKREQVPEPGRKNYYRWRRWDQNQLKIPQVQPKMPMTTPIPRRKRRHCARGSRNPACSAKAHKQKKWQVRKRDK